jgi:uncharacterized protein (DUF362 family)
MVNKRLNDTSPKNISRRKFINTLGATTAGLLIAPYVRSDNIFAYGHDALSPFVSMVGITRADKYERSFVREKVELLFESIGGISDVVKPGDKVALKINLVGGSGSAYSTMHRGKNITETMWTHPEVLRAVGELLLDEGIRGEDLYIVEALWDNASYNNFGYRNVQESLGAQFVDLDKKEPYDDFMDLPVGEHKYFYDSFTCNRILDEIDVYISIGKMKQHYEAGVTHSIKNQVGIVPKDFYTLPGNTGNRSALHYEGGNIRTHLPKAICDLFLARPVHLSIVDGIMSANGGEGVWNPTFVPAEYNILLAGKDPVATDSIASYLMGNDPEADTLRIPRGEYSDNYLKMLSELGYGTNKINQIEVVGDGADLITSAPSEYNENIPDRIVLSDNFPNPFNNSTTIKFYLPEQQYTTIKLYSVSGREIDTLVEGIVPAGQHVMQWTANNLASGVYFYVMAAGGFRESKKMIYQK